MRFGKNWILQFWRQWGASFLIAVLIATSFKSAIADWNDIPTGSMEPTILIGDRIYVNKLAFDLKIPYTTRHLAQWNDPERGEIVVFFSPADNKRLVKRVIGLPGDTVAMRDNRLILNRKAVCYSGMERTSPGRCVTFIENLDGRNHRVRFDPSKPARRNFGPVVIPAGHYFLMGDYRDNSFDSRYFGPVHRDRIVGAASLVVFSRDLRGTRWNRIFRPLK